MSMIEINLLPREMRRKTGGLSLSRPALIGFGVVVTFVVLLVGLTATQSWRYDRVEAAIARAQSRADAMRGDIALVDHLTQVKGSIMRRMEAIEKLDRDRGDWVRNLEDVLAIVPDYLWLSGFHRDESKGKPAGSPGADTAAVPTNKYILDGYCYSISSLANMILNMQDSPRFRDIALKRAQFTDLKSRRVYQFSLTCLLEPIDKPPADMGDRPGPRQLGEQPADDEATSMSAVDDEEGAQE
jgi:Tfp pilus assembly protein PilN